MCDTMMALPPATEAGGVLVAKDSDRERNEARPLAWHPRRRHVPGGCLRCTCIGIPQAAETRANAHGVVIGNESVFAAIPPARDPALIGMDLVRLGLERGASAAEAVAVIATLPAAHGQGSDCGHLREHFGAPMPRGRPRGWRSGLVGCTTGREAPRRHRHGRPADDGHQDRHRRRGDARPVHHRPLYRLAL